LPLDLKIPAAGISAKESAQILYPPLFQEDLKNIFE
jgi:hypothetical protein